MVYRCILVLVSLEGSVHPLCSPLSFLSSWGLFSLSPNRPLSLSHIHTCTHTYPGVPSSSPQPHTFLRKAPRDPVPPVPQMSWQWEQLASVSGQVPAGRNPSGSDFPLLRCNVCPSYAHVYSSRPHRPVSSVSTCATKPTPGCGSHLWEGGSGCPPPLCFRLVLLLHPCHPTASLLPVCGAVASAPFSVTGPRGWEGASPPSRDSGTGSGPRLSRQTLSGSSSHCNCLLHPRLQDLLLLLLAPPWLGAPLWDSQVYMLSSTLYPP